MAADAQAAPGAVAPVGATVVDDGLAEAARGVLAEHGLGGLTMERVASVAGVSRMTLHRRGVGRAEIVAALVERMVAAERAELWIPLTEDGDPASRLRAVLDRRCRLAERHLPVLEALDVAARDAIFHGDNGMTRPEFTAPLQRLLADGAADGSLVSADPEEDATLLYNLVGHTYRHMRTGHGWSPDRAREAVLRIAMEGIVAR
jgi:AcrR family transcriptional regulator